MYSTRLFKSTNNVLLPNSIPARFLAKSYQRKKLTHRMCETKQAALQQQQLNDLPLKKAKTQKKNILRSKEPLTCNTTKRSPAHFPKKKKNSSR